VNRPGGKLLGAVLAGGQARRFGADKAFARLGGQPLVAHAIALLAPLTDAVIVCGRDDAAVCGAPAIHDRPRPGLGPLGGLGAALHHAGANGFAAVVTIPCDTPLLPDGLLGRLLAAGAFAAVVAPAQPA
jgi:molybdopterin-guanine dinucleotide biosynthesis protein A